MERYAAVAIVALQANGRPLAGVVGKLESGSGMSNLLVVTNADGYDEFKLVPIPFAGTLRIAGAAKYVDYAISIPAEAVNVSIRLGGSKMGPFDIVLPAVQPFKRPFTPAPRVWTGNFCGIRLGGAPPVAGGANDPSLILSWFYDFYPAEWREKIRSAWKNRPVPYLDVVLSWPDCRARGWTPQMFRAMCDELIAEGFRPCPFLASKDFDPPDVDVILAGLQELLPLLVGVVPRVCKGWELNLWLTPAQVQQLIDAIAPMFVAAGCKTYVHFFAYMSYPIAGDNAVFWHANVGKLTGVLNERDQRRWPDQASYLDFINDCLERIAGNDGMPTSNGIDGNPFDFIALEITAQDQFNEDVSEAEGDAWGRACINAPHRTGPAGEVRVMGSGNGQ